MPGKGLELDVLVKTKVLELSLEEKVFFNQASAEKLGWSPDWFGCEKNDSELVKKIEEFQKNHGLSPDGLCGGNTFKILYTNRVVKNELLNDKLKNDKKDKKYLFCAGQRVPISWDKVVTLDDKTNKLSLKAGTRGNVEKKRNVKMFVVHWDATVSSRSCVDILNKRGLGVQFCIDNDGTIHQLCDANLIAYHAGTFNDISIGVEISNAFYTKYQTYYENKGFGKRPIIKGEGVHGRKLEEFLGFFPEQIEALKALLKCVCGFYNIPMQSPEENGKAVKNVFKDAKNEKFSGVVCHFHLDENKIDCAGLDLIKICNEIMRTTNK